MWWGYSAALDLLEELTFSINGDYVDRESINVLIVGGSDGRHLIKTLSEINRKNKVNIKINFYVIEQSLDVVARQMLLLTLVLEPSNILGLQEKAIMFLEIFGNTIIRPSTYNYIVSKSGQLIHMVTDLDFMKKRLPMVSISNLKYRERDGLETIFKFWQQFNSKNLNIESMWDNRLRSSLSNRFDSKMGVFDWDYNMKLCKLGRDSISSAEYKKWRLKGIAYSWLDRVASKPNLTLVSGVQKINGQVITLGYRGDIENGPFAAFGLRNKNEQYRRENPRKCTISSQRNVMIILQAIVNAEEPITLPDENELEGVVVSDDSVEKLCDLTKCDDASDGKNRSVIKENYSAISVGSANVIFLPVSSLSDLPKKEGFKNFFDIIVFSQCTTNHMNPLFLEIARNQSSILVETIHFVLSHKKDDIKLFDENIDVLAAQCNCEPVQRIGDTEDFFKRYEFTRKLC